MILRNWTLAGSGKPGRGGGRGPCGDAWGIEGRSLRACRSGASLTCPFSMCLLLCHFVCFPRWYQCLITRVDPCHSSRRKNLICLASNHSLIWAEVFSPSCIKMIMIIITTTMFIEHLPSTVLCYMYYLIIVSTTRFGIGLVVTDEAPAVWVCLWTYSEPYSSRVPVQACLPLEPMILTSCPIGILAALVPDFHLWPDQPCHLF